MRVAGLGGGQGPPYPTVISYHIISLENEVFVNFFDFDWLDMLDNTAYDSNKCS